MQQLLYKIIFKFRIVNQLKSQDFAFYFSGVLLSQFDSVCLSLALQRTSNNYQNEETVLILRTFTLQLPQVHSQPRYVLCKFKCTFSHNILAYLLIYKPTSEQMKNSIKIAHFYGFLHVRQFQMTVSFLLKGRAYM